MARDARVFEKNMFYFILITLHLLAAAVWIGGMLFLGLVLTPVLCYRPPDERASLLSAVGRRFLKVAWSALGAILVTGPLLWIKRGFDVTPVLVVKLTLVGVILVLSVLHDFVLGPRLIERLRGGGHGDETLRLRRQVALLARLNVLCALVVLILGLAISRGL